MKKLAACAIATILCGSLYPAGATAGALADPDPIAASLAKHLGVASDDAAKILDNQANSFATMADLIKAQGLRPENFAIADDGTLVASQAATGTAAQIGPRAGLRVVQSTRGPAEVDSLFAQAAAELKGMDSDTVTAISADYPSGEVIISVTASALSNPKVQSLNKIDGLRLEIVPPDTKPAPAFNAVPGNYMDIVPGTYCSMGVGTWLGRMISAGHCALQSGQLGVIARDGAGREVGRSNSSLYQNDGYDIGRFSVNSGNTISRGYSNYVGGVTPYRSWTSPVTGAFVCKSGTTSEITCGRILSSLTSVYYGSTRLFQMFSTDACGEGGDSGGPIVVAGTNDLVGIFSGVSNSNVCGYNSGYASQGIKTSWGSRIDFAFNYYNDSLPLP
ncbi:S1 family peptidase [Terrabacter carboxydivorans]|uniref:Serine protease n=1 Tax=Terrabacter carboxydivorans TaxID=619730 RepID=A0ABN3M749_9MICO